MLSLSLCLFHCTLLLLLHGSLIICQNIICRWRKRRTFARVYIFRDNQRMLFFFPFRFAETRKLRTHSRALISSMQIWKLKRPILVSWLVHCYAICIAKAHMLVITICIRIYLFVQHRKVRGRKRTSKVSKKASSTICDAKENWFACASLKLQKVLNLTLEQK